MKPNKNELKALIDEITDEITELCNMNFDVAKARKQDSGLNNENPEPDGACRKTVEVTWNDPKTGEKRKGLMEKRYLRITVEDDERD